MATTAAPHPTHSFTGTPADRFLNPFRLHVDPMARLLLINLTGVLDPVYSGFEPQAFDDAVHGRGLIVLGWRRDGRVDVFHQPNVRVDPATYTIVGDGLHRIVERPLEGARFAIGRTGVDADLSFEDLVGRRIELRIVERSPRPSERFGLLAPMGDVASRPSAMPLVLLRDFGFVRVAGSEVHIAIDGRPHKVGQLPIPIDGQRRHMLRYAEAPLIATVNPAHDGPLTPIAARGDTVDDAGDLVTMVDGAGHRAIERIERRSGEQFVRWAFDPPFPNPLDLRSGAECSGRFTIESDPRVGRVRGDYRVQREDDRVRVRVVPSGGWTPNERRWSVRFIYAVAPVFRRWPKTYVWEGEIEMGAAPGPTMRSGWTRVGRG
jgi:hypothetical protein